VPMVTYQEPQMKYSRNIINAREVLVLAFIVLVGL
jgi:hypothetical protein